MKFVVPPCLVLLPSMLLVSASLATGEQVQVAEVLGPLTFRTTDGRTVRYLGLFLPAWLEAPEHLEMRALLTRAHRELLPGRPVQLLSRADPGNGPVPVEAFVLDGDTVLNVTALRRGLGAVEPRALGQLGSYEEAFLETQQEAGVGRRGIWAAGSQGWPLVASRRSQKVHRPFCAWAYRISARNRASYPSLADARAAGMRPCLVCLADQDRSAAPASGLGRGLSWPIAVAVLCVLALLSILLFGPARPPALLRAIRRLRRRHEEPEEEPLRPAASRRRAPSRKDCDLPAVVMELNRRWSRYLDGRGLTWSLAGDPGEATVAVPDAAVKQVLTSVLVHFRDTLPAGSSFSSRLSSSDGAVTLTFSADTPPDGLARVAPSAAALEAWRAFLPAGPASIEVPPAPESVTSPAPIVTLVLPMDS